MFLFCVLIFFYFTVGSMVAFSQHGIKQWAEIGRKNRQLGVFLSFVSHKYNDEKTIKHGRGENNYGKSKIEKEIIIIILKKKKRYERLPGFEMLRDLGRAFPLAAQSSSEFDADGRVAIVEAEYNRLSSKSMTGKNTNKYIWRKKKEKRLQK